MGKYDLKLRPIHYACVSGGKDSLYDKLDFKQP